MEGHARWRESYAREHWIEDTPRMNSVVKEKSITFPSNETGRKDEQERRFLPTRATKFQRHRIEQNQALEDGG